MLGAPTHASQDASCEDGEAMAEVVARRGWGGGGVDPLIPNPSLCPIYLSGTNPFLTFFWCSVAEWVRLLLCVFAGSGSNPSRDQVQIKVNYFHLELTFVNSACAQWMSLKNRHYA